MAKKYFLRFFSVSTLAVFLGCIIAALIFSFINEKEETNKMLGVLDTIIEKYDIVNCSEDVVKKLDDLSGYRITIIAQDGSVVLDSRADPYKIENHSTRPEMKMLETKNVAIVKRKSTTISESLLYAAKKTERGIVVRISLPIRNLERNVTNLIPAFVAGIVAATFFSALMAEKMSGEVMKPYYDITGVLNDISSGKKIEKQQPINDSPEILKIYNDVYKLSDNISASINELKYEKNKSEYIFNNLGEGLILLDNNLNIIYINKTAEKIFMLSDVAKNNTIFHLTHNKSITDKLELAILSREKQMMKTDKLVENRIFNIKITPFSFNEESLKPGAIIIADDITEQETAERARTEFVANASHELKTPVTSIKGFAEMLSSGMITDEAKKTDFLNRIQSEISRMVLLIEDIMQIYRLESGKITENIEPLELFSAAQNIAESLDGIASRRNIKISVTGEKVFFNIEQKDYEHILVNLIENAIKYNKDNGIVAVKVIEENNSLIISVEDTGIGIPPDQIARVFERFYRVDKGRSKKIGGTGLGLAIVKHTVNLYGGQISIESKVDVGTKIMVSFKEK